MHARGMEQNAITFFFYEAVKPITSLCWPQQLRLYGEALRQLLSPEGLITLPINLACMTLCIWEEPALGDVCVYA